ncbi:hypothetical protein PMZ80_010131 [Knufia obscura]|uniref:DUF6604 domain-containing protein n=2 Tax=Knufia TaxID=430999 RepID=A0AAN8F7I7_9EURO|nr:hypothetical protein PMZ80_010131 [Knufia obscura]KAK5952871.1 hypothetical protein OHC33_005992 [Knufia fluminis]
MTTKLASHHFSSYIQYKSEEKTFIQYVLRTAQARGYLSATVTGSQASLSDDDLAIYQIIPYVRQMANDKSIITIPKKVAKKLRNVTALRAKCAAWYQDNTKVNDLETQKRNHSHAYPLRALHQIYNLLRSKIATDVQDDLDGTVDQIDPTLTVNRFEMLTEEEKVETHAAEDADISGGSQFHTNKFPLLHEDNNTYEPQKNDLLLERYCIAQAYEAIYAIVVQQWLSYASDAAGHSLMEAALVTNQAIDLVRQREQESCFPLDVGLTEWEMNVPTKSPSSSLFASLQRTKTGHIEEPLSRMQAILYEVFSKNDTSTRYEPAKQALQDIDYFHAPVNGQAAYEIMALGSFRKTWANVLQQEGNGRPDPESVRLLRWLSKSYKDLTGPQDVPLCVAFAMRVEVAISYICRDHSSFGRDQTVRLHEDGLVQAREHLANLQDSSSYCSEMSEQIRQQSIDSLDDFLAQIPAQCQLFSELPPTSLPWVLTYMGVCSFELRCFLGEIFVTAMVDLGFFADLARIYDMCQKEGGTSTRWHDLYFLEAGIGEKYIYHGQKPSSGSRDRYLDQTLFAHNFTAKFGDKPEDWERNFGKVHRRETGRLRPRFWAWPLAGILRGRINNHVPFRDATLERARLFLRGNTVQRLIKGTVKTIKFEDDGTFSDHAELWKFASRGPQLDNSDLLHLLRCRLRAELPLLQFSFDRLSIACIELASMLAQEWQKQGWFPYGADAGRRSPLHQTFVVLMDLSTGLQMSADQKSPARDKAQHKVDAVGKIFDAWLSEHGDSGLRQTLQTQRRLLSALPQPFLKELRRLHEIYGTPDGLFGSEQLGDILWLDDMFNMEAQVVETFGKPLTKDK